MPYGSRKTTKDFQIIGGIEGRYGSLDLFFTAEAAESAEIFVFILPSATSALSAVKRIWPSHMRILNIQQGTSNFEIHHSIFDRSGLYAPPPEQKSRMGRPRIKGRKLPTPQQVVARAQLIPATVSWYGGS